MFVFKLKNFIKIGMIITLVSAQYSWAGPSPYDNGMTRPVVPGQANRSAPSLQVLEMQALAPHLDVANQTILVGHLQNSMNKIGETQALSDEEMKGRIANGVTLYLSLGKTDEAEQLRNASKDIPLVRVALAQMQKEKSELINAIKSDFTNPEFLEMNGLRDFAQTPTKQCRKIAAEDDYGPLPLKPDGTPYQRPPLNHFKNYLEKKFLPREKPRFECYLTYLAMTAAVLAAGFLVFVWNPLVVTIPVAIVAIPLSLYAYYLYFKGEIPWDFSAELERQGLKGDPKKEGCPRP